jgi:hypothetical protein
MAAWNLPGGHFVGNVDDPRDNCHGGVPYDPPNIVDLVISCQRGLVAAGCVPGETDWRSGWSDGRFEAPYSTDAAAKFHARFYPGQPYPGEIWDDDYAVLRRVIGA